MWSASKTTTGELAPSVSSEWSNSGRVAEYLAREMPHRDVAEEMLLSALPQQITRFVDLGTGDGRLLALVRLIPLATPRPLTVRSPHGAQTLGAVMTNGRH